MIPLSVRRGCRMGAAYLLPCCVAEPGVIHRVPADTTPLSDPISVTRVLCGAMILPTIATIVGKIMFGKVESNFQRTLMVRIPSIA